MNIHQALVDRAIETMPIEIGSSLATFLDNNPHVEIDFQHGYYVLVTNEHTWCLISSTLSLREALITLNNSSSLC